MATPTNEIIWGSLRIPPTNLVDQVLLPYKLELAAARGELRLYREQETRHFSRMAAMQRQIADLESEVARLQKSFEEAKLNFKRRLTLADRVLQLQASSTELQDTQVANIAVQNPACAADHSPSRQYPVCSKVNSRLRLLAGKTGTEDTQVAHIAPWPAWTADHGPKITVDGEGIAKNAEGVWASIRGSVFVDPRSLARWTVEWLSGDFIDVGLCTEEGRHHARIDRVGCTDQGWGYYNGTIKHDNKPLHERLATVRVGDRITVELNDGGLTFSVNGVQQGHPIPLPAVRVALVVSLHKGSAKLVE